MSDTQSANGSGGTADRPPRVRVPFMQQVLDNHFLLLFIGVVVPTVFYLIWGILEIAQIPIAS